MSLQTKIQLSDFEKELLNDPGWILTKNNIIKKVQQLLGAVQENIIDYTHANPKIFPAEVLAVSPKISKGENYLGLPWLILDYPRSFDKENIFAIRTMFWWGKMFSITLHLSGTFKQRYSKTIQSHYEELKQDDFYYCIHEDQWHHHLETENYKRLREFSFGEWEAAMRENFFLKLAKEFPLSIWDEAIEILSSEWVRMTALLH